MLFLTGWGFPSDTCNSLDMPSLLTLACLNSPSAWSAGATTLPVGNTRFCLELFTLLWCLLWEFFNCLHWEFPFPPCYYTALPTLPLSVNLTCEPAEPATWNTEFLSCAVCGEEACDFSLVGHSLIVTLIPRVSPACISCVYAPVPGGCGLSAAFGDDQSCSGDWR
jgi:hypothetical protein